MISYLLEYVCCLWLIVESQYLVVFPNFLRATADPELVHLSSFDTAMDRDNLPYRDFLALLLSLSPGICLSCSSKSEEDPGIYSAKVFGQFSAERTRESSTADPLDDEKPYFGVWRL